jgi:hypothetical protein
MAGWALVDWVMANWAMEGWAVIAGLVDPLASMH